MNLHHSNEGGVHVVTLCLLRVEYIDRVGSTGDCEDGLEGEKLNHRKSGNLCNMKLT